LLIFELKNTSGYFDARTYTDADLNDIPVNTVVLNLEHARITDVGLESLPDLNNLRCIDLDSTEITDRSMEFICRLSALEEVWLEDTAITDRGLEKLELLPKVKFVSTYETKVSEAGKIRLKSKIPGLQISG